MEKKCTFTIHRGPSAGTPCDLPVHTGHYCKRHYQKYTCVARKMRMLNKKANDKQMTAVKRTKFAGQAFQCILDNVHFFIHNKRFMFTIKSRLVKWQTGSQHERSLAKKYLPKYIELLNYPNAAKTLQRWYRKIRFNRKLQVIHTDLLFMPPMGVFPGGIMYHETVDHFHFCVGIENVLGINVDIFI